jgi:hypothetical protein
LLKSVESVVLSTVGPRAQGSLERMSEVEA